MSYRPVPGRRHETQLRARKREFFDRMGRGRGCPDAAARAAGVRAVGPLAAAFLPAFLMIGVVPVVVSLALPFLATGSA